jgi:hypothetical protein
MGQPETLLATKIQLAVARAVHQVLANQGGTWYVEVEGKDRPLAVGDLPKLAEDGVSRFRLRLDGHDDTARASGWAMSTDFADELVVSVRFESRQQR